MMNEPLSPNPAVTSLPTPGELQDSEWALRSMQRNDGWTPQTLAEQASKLASEHKHLSAEALGPKEMDKLGMGALAAVGRRIAAAY